MAEFSHTEPRTGSLTLSGELTLEYAAEAKGVLLAALARLPSLELNLLNVSRIDTAGVQLLLLLQREASQVDKSITCLGYSLAVEEVLRLLDLLHLFGLPGAVVWS